ncbi:MAG: DUF86 domain-containing protein [Candidatus Omnitrophica bacterium]|nr:DUF86 domain-containing protein [Candidatus Omnitrophota bacterium]
MRRTDREFLCDILEASTRIKSYINSLSYNEFLANIEKQDAVIRNIEIIGEATKNLSDEFKNKYKEIEWKKISGMRDKIIHFYFGVNLEIVWKVAKDEVPKLKEFIVKILEHYNK